MTPLFIFIGTKSASINRQDFSQLSTEIQKKVKY